MTALRQDFIQRLELKGFSPMTIRNYIQVVARISKFFNRSPLDLTNQQIKDYFHHHIKNNLLAPRSINLHIGALKTFYNFMLPESDTMNGITAMKEPSTFPDVLTKGEVISLLTAPSNIKHRAILEVLYSGGIRLQECCDLELCDIKRSEHLLHIKSGKGKKERYTIISQHAIDTLTNYYRVCRPRKYLFEGRFGNQY